MKKVLILISLLSTLATAEGLNMGVVKDVLKVVDKTINIVVKNIDKY